MNESEANNQTLPLWTNETTAPSSLDFLADEPDLYDDENGEVL